MWMRPPWCTEGLSLHNLLLISLDRRCAEGFAISRSLFRNWSCRVHGALRHSSLSVTMFSFIVFSKFNSFDFHCHHFLCWLRSYRDTFLFDFIWTLHIKRSDSAHCNRYAPAQNDMWNSIHCTRKVHDFHSPTIDTTTTCCYHGCRDYRHRSTY